MPAIAGAFVFVVVDAVDRPHGLFSVAEVEDSLDLLHKVPCIRTIGSTPQSHSSQSACGLLSVGCETVE